MKIKELFKISSLPVVFASLCCLSPVIFVLLGLSTVSFASSLANSLYGEYKWVFRAVGLFLLTLSVTYYLRRQKGICTLDEAKKRRTEIINVVALSLIAGIVGYLFFLYVVVEYLGIWLGLWSF